MTYDEIISECDDKIARHGGLARVALVLPIEWAKDSSIKLCKGGPRGEIVATVVDGSRVIATFGAAEIKTYLEENAYDNTTSRLGN
jgi:hypothetical protein